MLSAFWGFLPSLPLTNNVPIIEEIRPIAESKQGNTAYFQEELPLNASTPSEIAEIREPA